MLIRAERKRLPERSSIKKYKSTYSFSDGAQPLFELDVMGNVMSDLVEARDPGGASAWSTKRNRALMPTLWRLKDADGREVGALRQRIMRRGIWRAETPEGSEIFTLRDPRKGFTYLFDLPGAPDTPDFVVLQGDREIGALARVARDGSSKGGGPLKRLKRLFMERDWVMQVYPENAPDPRLAGLAILLVQEVTIRFRGID